MIYPIRLYGDPALRKKARTVTDFSDIPRLAQDMLDTMYSARGVGLAGPQIDQNLRIFVAAEYSDDEDEDTEQKSTVLREFIVVNPEIEIIDKTKVFSTEGCLSIPEIYIEDVPRNKAIRLNYQNERGEMQTIEVDDYLARVFQHEFDHLDGKLFLDLLPLSVKNEYRQELAKMQRIARARLKKK